jgi:sodium/potassium-transporting ATPase subunit alpha
MSSVLAYGGLPEHYDSAAYLEAVNVAQSIYFFTLVIMQWGNLLSTRTRRLSIFSTNPFGPKSPNRNVWIPPAMLVSLGFLFFFSYVPPLQDVLLTRVSCNLSADLVGSTS